MLKIKIVNDPFLKTSKYNTNMTFKYTSKSDRILTDRDRIDYP